MSAEAHLDIKGGAEELLVAVSKPKYIETLALSSKDHWDTFLARVRQVTTAETATSSKKAKQRIRALLKVCQLCLQKLASMAMTLKESSSEGSLERFSIVLYHAISVMVHALEPRVAGSCGETPSIQYIAAGGKLGFEKILYHAIARGTELGQHRDVQAFTRMLARRVKLIAGESAADGCGTVPESSILGVKEDQWNGKGTVRNPLATKRNEIFQSSNSQGKKSIHTSGTDPAAPVSCQSTPRSAAPDRNEDKLSTDSKVDYGFGRPTHTCDSTLISTVCGASINGLRSTVENFAAMAAPGTPLDKDEYQPGRECTGDRAMGAHDFSIQVEEIIWECLPWIKALRSRGSVSKERGVEGAGEEATLASRDMDMADEYSERLYHAVQKAGVTLDRIGRRGEGGMEGRGGNYQDAFRLRSRLVSLVAETGVPSVQAFIPQLWRAGVFYEKAAVATAAPKGARQGKKGSENEAVVSSSRALLLDVLGLYEYAAQRLLFGQQTGSKEWAANRVAAMQADGLRREGEDSCALSSFPSSSPSPPPSSWALHVEVLDWLRHYTTLCLKVEEPERAVSLLQEASQRCRSSGEKGEGSEKMYRSEPMEDTGLLLTLSRGILRVIAATVCLQQRQQSELSPLKANCSKSKRDRSIGQGKRTRRRNDGGMKVALDLMAAALTDIASAKNPLSISPNGDNSKGKGEWKGAEKGIRAEAHESFPVRCKAHLVRTWRALARLPAVLPSIVMADSYLSEPVIGQVLIRAYMALADTARILLFWDQKSCDKSIRTNLSTKSNPDPNLKTTFLEGLLRAALLLINLFVDNTSSDCAIPSLPSLRPLPSWLGLTRDCDDPALMAMACLRHVEDAINTNETGKSSNSNQIQRRLGSAFFSLGRALINSSSLTARSDTSKEKRRSRLLLGLGPLARGCRLLERECSMRTSPSKSPSSPEPQRQNPFQQLQIDMRYATLAAAFKDVGAGRMAMRVAVHTLSLMYQHCSISADSQRDSPSGPTSCVSLSRTLLRKLVHCYKAPYVLDEQSLQTALQKEARTPEWCMAELHQWRDSEEETKEMHAVLCLSLPSLVVPPVLREAVAKAEMSAYVAMVHAALNEEAQVSSDAEQEERHGSQAAEHMCGVVLAHRCCRESGLVSALYASVEGARMARILCHAPKERCRLFLSKLEPEIREEIAGEGAMEFWVESLDKSSLQPMERCLAPKKVYEEALVHGIRGLICAENDKREEAGVAVDMALQAWRQLCSIGKGETQKERWEETEVLRTIDFSVTRQCFGAVLDQLSVDGPSLRQAQVLETAMYLDQRGYFGQGGGSRRGNMKTAEEELLVSVVTTLFSRLELAAFSEAHAQTIPWTGLSRRSVPDVDIVPLHMTEFDRPPPSHLLSSGQELSPEAVLEDDLGESFLQSLSLLRETDHLISNGNLPMALSRLRRLAATCQGLSAPCSEDQAARMENQSGGEESLPFLKETSEKFVSTIVDDEAERSQDRRTRSLKEEVFEGEGANLRPPSRHLPPERSTDFLSSILKAGGWRRSWCLPECLLRMGQVWELLGNGGKASSYYKKALSVARKWVALGVAKRASRGRARVKGEIKGEVDKDLDDVSVVTNGQDETQLRGPRQDWRFDKLMEQVEVLIQKGDIQRLSTSFCEALDTYKEAREIYKAASALELRDVVLEPLRLSITQTERAKIKHCERNELNGENRVGTSNSIAVDGCERSHEATSASKNTQIAIDSAPSHRWRTLETALQWRQTWTAWLHHSVSRNRAEQKLRRNTPFIATSEAVALRSCERDLQTLMERKGLPVLERVEACLRLARITAHQGSAAEGLEQAWCLAIQSRCPRLIRDAGRLSFLAGTMRVPAVAPEPVALSNLELAGGEGSQGCMKGEGRGSTATWRLISSVGTSFGNSLRLHALRTPEGLGEVLPETWTVVTLALIPYLEEEGVEEAGRGHVLIGRIEGRKERGVTAEKSKAQTPRMVGARVAQAKEVKRLLAEFEAIMDGNHQTLHGRSAEQVAGYGKKEKAAWWKERESLDARLGSLIQEMEAVLGPWRWLLGGQLDKNRDEKLVAKVEAALSALGIDEANHGEDAEQASVPTVLRAALAGLVHDLQNCGEERQQRLSQACEAAGYFPTTSQIEGALDCLEMACTKVTTGCHTDNAATCTNRSSGRSSDGSSQEGDIQAICQDFRRLTVAGLKKELAARSLPTTGLKATLLARLEAAMSQMPAKRDDTLTRESCSPSASPSRAPLATRGAPSSPSEPSSPPPSSYSRPPGHTADNADEQRQPRGPVLLILDETLQCLPWECLPLLRGHSVSRCPSIEYIEAALRLRATSATRPCDATTQPRRLEGANNTGKRREITNTATPSSSHPRVASVRIGLDRTLQVPRAPGFYLLDPENNLTRTRATLQPTLARLHKQISHAPSPSPLLPSQANQNHPKTQHREVWKGLIGEAPTEECLKKELEESTVFIYCGHGSGELFLAREDVATLKQAPLAILMGCSSGRLRAPGASSIKRGKGNEVPLPSNRRSSRDVGWIGRKIPFTSPELFEPTGMALSYLGAGSPAVVGNLWDVTDRDIDRFCVALLEELFPKAKASTATDEILGDEGLVLKGERAVEDSKALILPAVARARGACKLRHLVGAAPVAYGLPSELVD